MDLTALGNVRVLVGDLKFKFICLAESRTDDAKVLITRLSLSESEDGTKEFRLLVDFYEFKKSTENGGSWFLYNSSLAPVQ